MRKFLSFITFILLFTINSKSQTNYEYVSEGDYTVNNFMGTIVFLDESTIFGEIKYNNHSDFVTLKKYISNSDITEDKVHAFHFSKVEYMYKNRDNDVIDYVYYIPIKTIRGLDFYEVVSHGKITFVRTEQLWKTDDVNTLVYEYYYVDEDNDLIPISKIRKQFKLLFGKDLELVNKFMKEHKMNYKDLTKNDIKLVSVLMYWNKL